jgi:hypothetical protein
MHQLKSHVANEAAGLVPSPRGAIGAPGLIERPRGEGMQGEWGTEGMFNLNVQC